MSELFAATFGFLSGVTLTAGLVIHFFTIKMKEKVNGDQPK